MPKKRKSENMSAPQEIGQIKELRPEEETYEMEAHHGEIDHDETIQQEAADPGNNKNYFIKKFCKITFRYLSPKTFSV